MEIFVCLWRRHLCHHLHHDHGLGRRRAFFLVRSSPIHRLTSTWAVVGLATNRAPPKLVPSCLHPATQHVRACPDPLLTCLPFPLTWRAPLHQEPVRRVRIQNRDASEIERDGPCSGVRFQTGHVAALWNQGGELQSRGFAQQAASLLHVASDPIPVLETVPDFAKSVDVSQMGRTCAERDTRS